MTLLNDLKGRRGIKGVDVDCFSNLIRRREDKNGTLEKRQGKTSFKNCGETQCKQKRRARN